MANEKDTKVVTAAPAAKSETVRPSVVFRAITGKSESKNGKMLANADICGLFAGFGLPNVMVTDFALRLDEDRTISVFMPSGPYGFRRVSTALGDKPESEIVATVTQLATSTPDAAKSFMATYREHRAEGDKLRDMLRDAWVMANDKTKHADGPFGVAIPLGK